MIRRNVFVAAVAVPGFASILGCAPSLSAAEIGPARALVTCAKEQAAQNAFSGVLLVAERGKPTAQFSYGLADPATRRANAPDTQFNLASMGKMFTAVAIGQLVDRGKLRFEDPVGRHLSGLSPDVAALTIDQLLTHRSGLGDYARMENREAIHAARTARDLLPVAVAGELRFTPGSKQSYSNSGYVVLGAVIEAVTGVTYADYVRNNVLKPAGMKSTTLDGSDRRAVAMTSMSPGGGAPVAGASRRPAPTIGGPRASPAGGAVSTAGDLVRFGEALRRHVLVSKPVLNRLWTPHVRSGERDGTVSGYGYGFTRVDAGADYAVGHGGGSLGTNAHFDFYPKSARSVVVLSNYDPPAATALIEASRRAFLQKAAPAAVCGNPSRARATEGLPSSAGGSALVATAPREAGSDVAPAAAEAEVRAAERRWLDAYEQRDAAAMDAILAEGFTITYPDGTVMAKQDVAAQLARMAGRPPSRFATEAVRATVSADTVVLTGTLITQSARGVSRARYRDVWVRRDGRWQVLSSRLEASEPDTQ
jgi:CubicO group peptidase (beta-lactamase class C family)/ketosteroid isomerase-like protein